MSKAQQKFEVQKLDKNVDRAADKAEELTRDVADRVKEAGRATRNFIDSVTEKAMDLRDKSETQVRNHPFSTSVYVFVAGAIIGAFLGRR